MSHGQSEGITEIKVGSEDQVRYTSIKLKAEAQTNEAFVGTC